MLIYAKLTLSIFSHICSTFLLEIQCRKSDFWVCGIIGKSFQFLQTEMILRNLKKKYLSKCYQF